jgi:4'-phosphopantetheinyl transferase
VSPRAGLTVHVTELWSFPTAQLRIGSRDVHVWCVGLDQPPPRVASLFELLSADERVRAQRFYFAHDEQGFIVARAVLRLLLGRYLHTSPRAVELAYGEHGKPYVTTEPLRFNLAHSQELALYAFARHRELGIDVEYIRPLEDYEQIAERFFSASETEALQALAPPERLEAFFRCWTRKEAFIKALGVGMRHPLHAFSVSLEPGDQTERLTLLPTPDQADRWTLRALSPAPGYVAALVGERRDWRLQPLRHVSLAGLVGIARDDRAEEAPERILTAEV